MFIKKFAESFKKETQREEFYWDGIEEDERKEILEEAFPGRQYPPDAAGWSAREWKQYAPEEWKEVIVPVIKKYYGTIKIPRSKRGIQGEAARDGLRT